MSCDCCEMVRFSKSPQKLRLLGIALISILGFAGVEAVVGWVSHSMALTADSGHMAADGLAIALAILAASVARRYRGIEVWAALLNGVGLLVMAIAIGLEAIRHLQNPPETILSLPMLVVAIIGLGVNGCNIMLLHRDGQQDLNMRGVLLHILADTLSSVGAIVAAIAIWLTDCTWADGAVGLGVSVLVGLGSLPVIRHSLAILLNISPVGVDRELVREAIANFPGIVAVEDLLIIAIAPGYYAVEATLKVDIDLKQGDRLLTQIQATLSQKFGIDDIRCQLDQVLSPPKLGFWEIGQTSLASIISPVQVNQPLGVKEMQIPLDKRLHQ